MRFNIPNEGISIPKISDEWPRKLVVLATILALVYVLPGEYRIAVLAVVTAVVYINDEELRVRARMINIMDYELVRVSAEVAEQKEKLETEIAELRELLEFRINSLRNEVEYREELRRDLRYRNHEPDADPRS